MATSKEKAIAAAKEAAKKSAKNKILDIKSKGAADAERNSYEPPPAQQGFSYDIMNYQAGWISTGRNLPQGVQQIKQPSVLGFRSGCRDYQDAIANIENQDVNDEDTTTAPNSQKQLLLDLGTATGPIAGILDNIYRPLIPSYDANSGATVVSDEAAEFPEDSIREQDSDLQRTIQANILEVTESPFLNLGKTIVTGKQIGRAHV